jgi:bifunctional ADP-heptose synthase (sugar kinase/adenylyltransferase)
MKELKSSPPRKKFNVFLAGDSCTDQYIYGNCDRLNPEAPVPILKKGKDIEVRQGMVFNVKSNLKSLGADVSIRSGGKPCIKTRYIDIRSGQQVLRVDEDYTSPRLNTNKLMFNGYNAIVISDYNKGFIDEKVILDIIKASKNIPIFIDTKIKDLKPFDSPNVFVKINELEYSQLFSKCSNLIVTQGGKGATYFHKNTSTHFKQPSNVNVVDVCGAGDTFLAALTLSFLETKHITKAIEFANAAASLTVQHTGNYSPSRQEVDIVLKSYYNQGKE